MSGFSSGLWLASMALQFELYHHPLVWHTPKSTYISLLFLLHFHLDKGFFFFFLEDSGGNPRFQKYPPYVWTGSNNSSYFNTGGVTSVIWLWVCMSNTSTALPSNMAPENAGWDEINIVSGDGGSSWWFEDSLYIKFFYYPPSPHTQIDTDTHSQPPLFVFKWLHCDNRSRWRI